MRRYDRPSAQLTATPAPPTPGPADPPPPFPGPDTQPDTQPSPQPETQPDTQPSTPPLAEGMGLSSERVPDDRHSIEGTGSRGGAQEHPAGHWSARAEPAFGEASADLPAPHFPVPRSDLGLPSHTSWQGIDRTVGEPRPGPVAKHQFDRRKNPGHSHS